jgi:hypothetical protein
MIDAEKEPLYSLYSLVSTYLWFWVKDTSVWAGHLSRQPAEADVHGSWLLACDPSSWQSTNLRSWVTATPGSEPWLTAAASGFWLDASCTVSVTATRRCSWVMATCSAPGSWLPAPLLGHCYT